MQQGRGDGGDTGALGEFRGGAEGFGGVRFHDALAGARSVAHIEEGNLAAVARAVEPAPQRNDLSLVLGQAINSDELRHFGLHARGLARQGSRRATASKPPLRAPFF